MNSPYKRTTYKGKPIDEHRKVMEIYLGKKLGRNEYVHHKNGNKRDNRIENLEVMTPLEHNREHFEKLPKTKICVECGEEFEPSIKHRCKAKHRILRRGSSMVGEAMKLYSENENYKLYQGSMLDMLEVIDKESVDSIVTDPPYELNFMGKGWDNAGISFQPDTWQKCYEVLKPGGYLLAFGGSRTFHRIACAIEDAGFEIRDTIMYLYGSGFPKSMSLSKQFEKKNDKENALKWKSWGTALKPSFEPIIVARKPFKGSLVDNVIEYGVGGINIDECRVGNEERQNPQAGFIRRGRTDEEVFMGTDKNRPKGTLTVNGRFPANTILTYDETDFDEVCGGFPNTKNITKTHTAKNSDNNVNFNASKQVNIIGYEDSGSASRYFYCAKASAKDRNEGLEEFNEEKVNDGKQTPIDNPFQRGETLRKNTHPTVKPTELMQYLVRLVSPEGATILDPFNGSGSTGKAVMYENKERNKNYKYIGIELTEEYLPISKARIEYVCNLEPEVNPQMSIFDLRCENENT